MKSILSVALLMVLNLTMAMSQGINAHLDSTFKQDSLITFSPGTIVTYDNFNKGAILSPMQLIKGKVLGFNAITKNGNDPNPEFNYILRGMRTLELGDVPLFIVDGFQVFNNDIIPVNSIESIRVLKNISETAAYGTNGANGVVIIETKQNQSQQFNLTYNGYAYMERFASESNYMTADEWRIFKNKLSSSSNSLYNSFSENMVDYGSNTDWRKEISQNLISHSHNVRISGGVNKTHFNSNLNINNNNGIIQKTGNTTYKGQFSVSQLAFKDRLKVVASFIGMEGSRNNSNRLPNSNYDESVLSYAYRYNPTVNIYDKLDNQFILNPVNNLDRTNGEDVIRGLVVDLKAGIQIIDNLKFESSYTRNYHNLKSDYHKTGYWGDYMNGNNDYEMKETTYNITSEDRITQKIIFDRSFKDYFIKAQLAYTYNNRKDTISYTYLNNHNRELIGHGFSKKRVQSSNKILAFLADFNYKNKYYISVSYLHELFKQNINDKYKVLNSPSIKAGWIISNERFKQKYKWLSLAKIRFGYGSTNKSFYTWNKDFYSGIIYDSDLYEKVKELNFGLDVKLLNNRIGFSVDYYNCKTDSLIIDFKLTKTSGFANWVGKSDISMVNNGWEIGAYGQPIKGLVNWTASFNISFNNNKLINTKDYYTDYVDSFGDFWGCQFGGFGDDGKALFVGTDGNPTSDFDMIEWKVLGNGFPTTFLGLTNNVSYKNWDLSISMHGSFGFEIVNHQKLYSFNSMNFVKYMDGGELLHSYSTLVNSDYIIESGDFLKIDDITLGYTLSNKIKYVNSVKIFATCNNAALFTNFTGGDPEMRTSMGHFYQETYPNTRVFLVGLDITL